MTLYYPTVLRRVQITPKTGTNITRYLYSRGPVGQVCPVLLLLTNQLAGFPAPIPFRFAYFCHAFPVNKYPRNSPSRTKQFGVLDNKSLIRRFVVQYRWKVLLVVCILTRPMGSSKYGTTRKNTQRYYTTKRPNNNYSMSPRWIWSDRITNERVARVGYNHFISNKGEWNNCFSKFSNRVLPPIVISTILQSEKF